MSDSKSIFQSVGDALRVFERSEASHLKVEEIDSVVMNLSKIHDFSISQKIYPDGKAFESDILKEMAVNEIRLLFVPFLIGYFYHIRSTVGNNDKRRTLMIVKESTKFLNIFLNICDSSSLFKNEPILQKCYKSYTSKDMSFFAERTSLIERTKQKRLVMTRIDSIVKNHKKSSSVSSSYSSSITSSPSATSSPSTSSSSSSPSTSSSSSSLPTTGNSEEFIVDDLSFSDDLEIRELFYFQLIQFVYLTFEYLKGNNSIETMLLKIAFAEENGIDLRKEEQGNNIVQSPFQSMMIRPDGSIIPVNLKTLATGGANATVNASLPQSLRFDSHKKSIFEFSSSSFSPVLSSAPSFLSPSPAVATGATVGSNFIGNPSLLSFGTTQSSGLTRLELQKKVFNPTPPYIYTLEEEQEYEAKRSMDRLAMAKQREEEEKRIPKPDPDKDAGAAVVRQREIEWDEFKDDHPAGSGNRKG